jgi:phage replication-related protein YjqB (UPF0714/DUF867 family)
MVDRFQSYQELCKVYKKSKDFDVRVKGTESSVAIIAPHGGQIEPATSEIAEKIAGESYNLYCFEGRMPKNNGQLHITSHNFDEPICLQLVAQCDLVLAIHGRQDKGNPQTVFLGGLDIQLVTSIAGRLNGAQFSSECHGHAFPATRPTNICNRGRTSRGAQLELPYTLRMELLNNQALLRKFSLAIRAAIHDRTKA